MAETDATKRALANFGKRLGVPLYLSAKAPRPAAARRQDEPNHVPATARGVNDNQQLGSSHRAAVPAQAPPSRPVSGPPALSATKALSRADEADVADGAMRVQRC